MRLLNRKQSFLPLLLLSFSLACSGLQTTIPAQSIPLAKGHSSSKQALISELAISDMPVMKTQIHPSEMFSYQAPEHWTINNSDSGVVLSSPNAVVLSVSFIRTGYKLSTSSFMKLASNTEGTQYGSKDQYQLLYQKEDKPNRFVSVEKTYITNGVKKIASSIYRQIGQSMYVVEMVGDRREITGDPTYEALFSAFNESIQDRQAQNLELPAYTASWEYSDTTHDYSIDVPVGWKLATDQAAPNVTQIQFNSPDGNATIESTLVEYEQNINLGFATKYVLKLIYESYAKDADDIRVTSDINLEEFKSEKITWLSRSGNYVGETYFEIRNHTQLFVLTHASNRLFKDVYVPVMNAAVLSFTPGSLIK